MRSFYEQRIVPQKFIYASKITDHRFPRTVLNLKVRRRVHNTVLLCLRNIYFFPETKTWREKVKAENIYNNTSNASLDVPLLCLWEETAVEETYTCILKILKLKHVLIIQTFIVIAANGRNVSTYTLLETGSETILICG